MFEKNLQTKIYFTILNNIEEHKQILSENKGNKEIDDYRLEAIGKLDRIINEVTDNIKSLERNSEWDKFTIAFYGETNAGKSTLIETLRILLNEKKKTSEHKVFKSKKLELDKLLQKTDKFELETISVENKFNQSKINFQIQLNELQQQIQKSDSEKQEYISKIDALIKELNVKKDKFSTNLLSLYTKKDELDKIILDKMVSSTLGMIKSLFHCLEEQKASAELSLQIAKLENKFDEVQSNVDQYEMEITDLNQKFGTIAQKYNNQKENLEKSIVVLEEQRNQELSKINTQINSAKRNQSSLILELKSQTDGAIIGDGRSDFTKEVGSYEFLIGEKEFILLDLPGIEGKEENVQLSIKDAVEKAHVIFYVSKKSTPPQKGDDENLGTIEKISKQLSKHSEVYFIYNKPVRNPRQLKNPLIDDNEEESLITVDKELAIILGENYISHRTLSAYPAFLSLGNFYDDKFSKDKAKFFKKLGNSDTMLELSQVREFSNWMIGQLVNNVKNKIVQSNIRKVSKTLEWTTAEIKEISSSFRKLEEKLTSNYKLTSQQLDSAGDTFVKNLSNTGRKSVNILKNNIRKQIYDAIDNGINDKGFEKELKNLIEKELNNFSVELIKRFDRQGKVFTDEISSIASIYQRYVNELVEQHVKSVKFDFDFQPTIDIKKNINIGNTLLSLVGDIIGILTTLAYATSPIGWVVLALSALGTIISVYKTGHALTDKEFQRAQQRKNADENIEKVVEAIQKELGKQLSEVKSEVYKGISEIKTILYEPVVQVKAMSETFFELQNEIKQLSFEVAREGDNQNGNN